MSEPTQERSGWRDLELSRRHRRWGRSILATDLDAIIADLDYFTNEPYLEYKVSGGVVVIAALIDYKAHTGTRKLESTSVDAQSTFATQAGVPFFIVHYTKGPWTFLVESFNDIARGKQKDGRYSELAFVSMLHDLRGLPMQLGLELDRVAPIEVWFGAKAGLGLAA